MSKYVVESDGTQRWFNVNGLSHREDGPALIYTDGEQIWYFNGRLHRAAGPAIDDPAGRRWWYIDGIRCYNNQSFQKAAKLGDEDMLMITLKYGDVE